MSQSNTRSGDFPILAGEDLTGKEGYLVKVTHDTGIPEVKLPTAIADLALAVVINEGEDADIVDIRPLSPDRNFRIKLKGTCNPGDVLVNADPTTAADAGKVRVQPITAGSWRGIAIAEEAGVDTQLVLCRPAMLGITVIAP